MYDMNEKNFSKTLDLKHLLPYGDTLNDGKVQISFTLPVASNEKGDEAARLLAKKMGLTNPLVAHSEALDENFSFYIVYGSVIHDINYEEIKVVTVQNEKLSKKEIENKIEEEIGREIIVIGASTGTDAHTVGIDAIMNMKGFAGHYGLERYKNIEAYNLGSQVENTEFVKKAIELKADVLLISQTVTQKDVHIENLTNLLELLEAENIRDKVVLICGGPRISHELAKELGYDAGFGSKKYSEDVASFFIENMIQRKLQ